MLWKGILLGFSVAAPVGPIGILCIRRTLGSGPLHGFATGLGAATADCLYGLVGGLGLTVVSMALVEHQTTLRLVGALFLGYLGLRTFFGSVRSETAGEASKGSLAAAYASSLFLTLTNPLTILSFAAIFAGLGIGVTGGYRSLVELVLGVFLGSAAWWLLLSFGSALFRGRITPRHMKLINRITGGILIAFAVSLLFQGFRVS